MISVDFIFVDFNKILDKFIYLFGIFGGNYFLPTMPSRYGRPQTKIGAVILITYNKLLKF